MQTESIEPGACEILAPTSDVIERMERATIDTQIATAHRFPRSVAMFKKRAMEMVTLDEETAQSCIYRRPVGESRDQQTGSTTVEYAEGKSIRMAEIVGACYGNLRVGSALVEVSERYVKARGFAHDLESNFAATSEVVESTVKRNGRPYTERMRLVIAKACLSKARRDATFQVVPGALCKALEEAARETAIGTAATLGKRRALVADWINKLGIEPARVWAALGIRGLEDVGLAELETLTGIRTAIKDHDITADEAFPPVGNSDERSPLERLRSEAEAAGVAVPEGASGAQLRELLDAAKAVKKETPAPAPERKPEPEDKGKPAQGELLPRQQKPRGDTDLAMAAVARKQRAEREGQIAGKAQGLPAQWRAQAAMEAGVKPDCAVTELSDEDQVAYLAALTRAEEAYAAENKGRKGFARR